MKPNDNSSKNLGRVKRHNNAASQRPRGKFMCLIGILLYKSYGIKWPLCRLLLQKTIKKIVVKLEGGSDTRGAFSKTLRRIMKDYHGVEIGMYSRGECFEDGFAEPYTTIGRYCSFARGVRIINVNHPMEFKSINEFSWHPEEKTCDKDLRKYIPLSIGNDVWMGHNAVILPVVTSIGDGAIIGASALVNKNIPPYAVVVGNPARIVRYRFPKEVIDELLESKWWDKDMDELLPNIEEFQQPYAELYAKKNEEHL